MLVLFKSIYLSDQPYVATSLLLFLMLEFFTDICQCNSFSVRYLFNGKSLSLNSIVLALLSMSRVSYYV